MLTRTVPLLPLAATFLVSIAVHAAEPAPAAAGTRVPAAEGPALALAIEAAQLAIATCAADGDQRIAVSVVDSAGVLKVLLAADGTSPRGVTSSTAKAVTSLTYKADTQTLSDSIKTNKALADEIAANTALNARPGGIVIRVGERIVGAIGVGGGRTDHACAVAGLAKVQDRL